MNQVSFLGTDFYIPEISQQKSLEVWIKYLENPSQTTETELLASGMFSKRLKIIEVLTKLDNQVFAKILTEALNEAKITQKQR